MSEIHGYKIDNVHQDTYKLISMLNRTEEKPEEEEDNKMGDEEKK